MISTPRAFRSVLAIAALGALTLSACGTESERKPTDVSRKDKGFASESGATVAKAADQAMTKVRAFRVSGTLTIDGAEVPLDVRNNGKGACGGSMKTPDGTFHFVSTRAASFIKADKAFWVKNAGKQESVQVMKMLDGRWAKTKATRDMDDMCNLPSAMVKEMRDESGGDYDGLEVGETSRVGASSVVELSDGGSTPDFAVLVDVDEPHYILRVVNRSGDEPGTITFSDFGKASVDVPAAGEYVDLR